MHVALVGAASGIGAATLALLTEQGHSVHTFDIVEPADATRWTEVDLEDVAAATYAAQQAEGPFDAVILNAGLPPRDGNQATLLAVNVLGVRAFGEAMLPKVTQGGALVITASRAGERWQDNLDQVKKLLTIRDAAALPDFVAHHDLDPLHAYCLSKEALMVWALQQTEALIEREIRVNCVCPSAVDTPILDDFKVFLKERAAQANRAGRAGTADEIAHVIAFLAGPNSGWIRGQHIYADGGVSAMGFSDTLGLTHNA